jgi:hypothetical protein
MSLGLAFADEHRIYLVSESEGLQHNVIPSKLRILQNEPKLAIVVTGGLEHWKSVFDFYGCQETIDAACCRVRQLLDSGMGPQNQAFGLICGYENDVPVCCRVDRPVGADTTKLLKTRLTTVQVIYWHLQSGIGSLTTKKSWS